MVEDIYCYSEFHAPSGAIIRQLPKLTDTKDDVQNLKIYIYKYMKKTDEVLKYLVKIAYANDYHFSQHERASVLLLTRHQV